MRLAIGIDTGGTFTDGVIVDLDTGTVISKAKAPTTREELKLGIGQLFRGLDRMLFPEVGLVSLSTTLATNSIVEGKGSRVGLLAAVSNPGKNGVSAAVSLAKPVIAVGAPVEAYFPAAVAALGARLVIPEHAEVANAFGAVTGRVVEKYGVHVRPAKPDGFTVAAAEVQRSFDTLDEATAFAADHAVASARAGAERRGGEEVVVSVEREEQALPLRSGWGDSVLIEVKILATAVGRPRSHS